MRLTISYRRRLWPAPDGANGAIVQAHRADSGPLKWNALLIKKLALV